MQPRRESDTGGGINVKSFPFPFKRGSSGKPWDMATPDNFGHSLAIDPGGYFRYPWKRTGYRAASRDFVQRNDRREKDSFNLPHGPI